MTRLAHMTLRALATVVALHVASPSAASGQNLLTNASFEEPNIVSTNNYALYGNGFTGITGWTVVGGTQLTPDTYLGLPASQGRQWLDLTGITGYDKGVRSNAISVMLGQSYTISWDIGNYLPFGVSTMGLGLNGGSELLYTNASLAATPFSPMNWMRFTRTWVADAPTLQLEFLGRANGSLSQELVIGLDNVSVTQDIAVVPEPASVVLLATGFAGIAVVARRKRA